MRIVLTPQVERDLDAIAAHIDQYHPRAAVETLTAIRKRIRQLAEFPFSGRVVGARAPQDLRRAVWRQYLITYFMSGDDLVVTRVLHGARDLDALLHDDEPPTDNE